MDTPPSFTLTRQQRNFFDTFGYLLIPGALKDQIADMSATFDQLHKNENGEVVDWVHEAHYMKSRWMLMQYIERSPELAALLDHPVINSVFSTLLGKDFLYRGSDANIFTGNSTWHSDHYSTYFKYRHMRLVTYLEPLDENNGAFRLIPGSHLFGDKFADLCERYVWKHEKKLGLASEQVPSVVIPTQPGDALFFDNRLKHATCNSQHNRRMISLSVSERFGDEDLPELAELVKMVLNLTGRDEAYRPEFISTATDSQRVHLEQCLEAFKLIQAARRV